MIAISLQDLLLPSPAAPAVDAAYAEVLLISLLTTVWSRKAHARMLCEISETQQPCLLQEWGTRAQWECCRSRQTRCPAPAASPPSRSSRTCCAMCCATRARAATPLAGVGLDGFWYMATRQAQLHLDRLRTWRRPDARHRGCLHRCFICCMSSDGANDTPGIAAPR